MMTEDEAARYEEMVAMVNHLRSRVQLLEAGNRYLTGREKKLKARTKAAETRLRAVKHDKKYKAIKPAGPMRMPFGCHKGESVKDVPPQYARWLLGKLREETLLAGSFSYRNDVLGAELMKVVLEGADVEKAVHEAVAEHKMRWATFDAERFLAWALKNKGRSLRVLWLGVSFMNKLCRKQESGRRLEKRLAEDVVANAESTEVENLLGDAVTIDPPLVQRAVSLSKESFHSEIG